MSDVDARNLRNSHFHLHKYRHQIPSAVHRYRDSLKLTVFHCLPITLLPENRGNCGDLVLPHRVIYGCGVDLGGRHFGERRTRSWDQSERVSDCGFLSLILSRTHCYNDHCYEKATRNSLQRRPVSLLVFSVLCHWPNRPGNPFVHNLAQQKRRATAPYRLATHLYFLACIRGSTGCWPVQRSFVEFTHHCEPAGRSRHSCDYRIHVNILLLSNRRTHSKDKIHSLTVRRPPHNRIPKRA